MLLVHFIFTQILLYYTYSRTKVYDKHIAVPLVQRTLVLFRHLCISHQFWYLNLNNILEVEEVGATSVWWFGLNNSKLMLYSNTNAWKGDHVYLTQSSTPF